jgi:exodeoxyribonuclease VII small subunit
LKDSQRSFSENLRRLEELVRLLEQPCELEQALEYYEEGLKLTTFCREKLQQTELRIEKLSLDHSL